ncbi:MAG: hypothetical protein WCC37_21740, partial [Candidatus Sulfotelmatobacter sp.]
MGAASVIAIIGFGATVFMLRVLVALLCERAPRSRYPDALLDSQRKEALHVLSGASNRTLLGDLRSSRDDRVDLLENQNHEKGEYDSGLTALDVCIISGRFGARSVHPNRSVRWE